MHKKYNWLIIPLMVFIFIYDMIMNAQIPLANDMIAHQPIKEWIKTLDIFPHWFPNLFSGMPSYGGYIYTPGHPFTDLLKVLLFNQGVKQWFYLSLGGLGLYFLLRFKNISILSSVFGGIAFSLTPHSFGLINAGHNNKIMALAFVPWVFFAVAYLFQSKSLKSILLLSIVSGFQLWVNHPQIVYYTWMFIFIWWAYEFTLRFLKTKSYSFVKMLCFLICSILITTMMVSDPYIDIFTFQKHSNRGAPSVLDDTNETLSGTKWDYATQWSFHPIELISFIFPYHFGLQNFSVKNRTNPSEFMKQGSYWGYMPFTQSTHYMGLLVLLLPLIAIGIRFKSKDFDKYEIFLWLISIIFLIIGFGKHFPIFYQILFDYAPFFSKFRIPSMIYLILIFTFTYLASASLDYIIKSNKGDIIISSKLILGSFIIICSIFFLFGESLFSFYSAGDVRFPNYVQFVQNIRKAYFIKGVTLALGLSICLSILIWCFVNDIIKKNFFSYALLLMLTIDLWVLDKEFLSLTKQRNFNNQFSKNSKIDYMLNDSNYFRIFPADDISSNSYAFWGLQSIGGYRAVKLRNYQDLMDIGGFRRPKILNMLNVKYLLTNKAVKNSSFKEIDGISGIYKNLDALPRAWFVDNLINVTSQKSSLSEVMDLSFRPKEKSVVVDYNGPNLIVGNLGEINELVINNNQVKIKCSTNGGSLLVLSEVYYKPGWKCKINGKASEIYQTNHVLRSVYIPDGNHEVLFYFDDTKWITARFISRSSFYITIVLVCFLFYRNKNEKLEK